MSGEQSFYTKRDAIEELKMLVKFTNDKRHKAYDRHLAEQRIKELVDKYQILGKDIY